MRRVDGTNRERDEDIHLDLGKDNDSNIKNTENQAVKQFVRDILGCNCPEKVFDIIQVEKTVEIPEITGLILDYRINIGNRLLIYLLDVKKILVIEQILILLEIGIRERNTRGFNRFRLAIVGVSGDDEHQQKIKEALVEKSEVLEKVHIHFINNMGIEDLRI